LNIKARHLALVSLGGIAGSLSRWAIAELIDSGLIATFIVNISGVALAGIFLYRLQLSTAQRLFLVTGFCGGFTTFSAIDVGALDVSIATAGFYVSGTLLTSLALLRIIRNPVSQ
jgi:CrcB protein